MKVRLLHTLLVASFGAMAITATAQNATPRDNPAGPNITTTAPQNGIQTGTPSGAVPSGTGYGTTGTMTPGTMTPGTMNSPTTYKRLSDTDMRAYKEARMACDRMAAGAAQDTCRAQLGSKWSSVDPKCQKVAASGNALDECLKGSDHAN